MRKQFTYFIAVAALSTTLIGCGSKEPVVETPATEVETTVETESPNVPATDEVTEENAETTEQVEETPATDETQKEDVQVDTTQKEETKTENVAQKETESKPATTSNTTSKPSTNTSSTNKPSTTTKPQATSKPSTTTKPSTNTSNTSKPSTTTKPQATTKPESTSKPEATTKPEATPTPEAPVQPETASLTASQVFDKVITGVELPATMEMDSTMISDMYGIDTSILKSYKVVAPMMSAHITEIAVFEVKDASDIEVVKAGINNRAGAIDPRYLYPSLQEAYERRQTVVNGNYIFFAMDDNIDTFVANFNNALK